MESIRSLYARHGDKIRYLVVGGLTTLVSVAAFWLFNALLGIGYVAANALSWICAVAFAFCGNKWFVFQKKDGGLIPQALAFAAARLVTLGLETGLLALLVEVLSVGELPAKIISTFIVIIANYFLSGLLVFGAKHQSKGSDSR